MLSLIHRAGWESWTRDLIFFRRVNFLGILSPAGPQSTRSSARAYGSSGSADLKKVGLTRRGPPTCRHRRELLRNTEENFQRSHIPSHLTRRAKDGRPRRVSPTAYHLPLKNQNSTIINRQFFLRHTVGDKSAGCGDPALLGALPVTWSKLVSPAPNFTNPLIYSIRLGPTN